MAPVLLVIDREDPVRQCANRGLMLARYLGTRLDILLCDTERAYSPRPDQNAAQVRSEAHQFLEALRTSVHAPDVHITTDSAANGLLAAHVAEKVRTDGSRLVVKSFERRRRQQTSTVDWALIRTCRAPVLLTHGRPWRPRARFAAALGVVGAAPLAASLAVARTIVALRDACSAEFELVAVGSSSTAHQGLQEVATESNVDARGIHLLTGDIGESLPKLAALREYDVLALGVSDEPSFPALVQRVADRLEQSVCCDVLLVPPDQRPTRGMPR